MEVHSNSAPDSDLDIQNVFDNLVLPENDFVKEAYQEGFEQGKKEGYEEGFQFGRQKGSEISSEIGFFKGFAKGWIALLSGSDVEFRKILAEQLQAVAPLLNSSTCTEVLSLCQGVTSESKNLSAFKALTKLLQLVESFPAEISKDTDLLEHLSTIRAKYKQCCSLLKVESIIPAAVENSF